MESGHGGHSGKFDVARQPESLKVGVIGLDTLPLGTPPPPAGQCPDLRVVRLLKQLRQVVGQLGALASPPVLVPEVQRCHREGEMKCHVDAKGQGFSGIP